MVYPLDFSVKYIFLLSFSVLYKDFCSSMFIFLSCLIPPPPPHRLHCQPQQFQHFYLIWCSVSHCFFPASRWHLECVHTIIWGSCLSVKSLYHGKVIPNGWNSPSSDFTFHLSLLFLSRTFRILFHAYFPGFCWYWSPSFYNFFGVTFQYYQH